ncbi:GL27025 [Drosophila persimilis]|uniref:GL27025 n=1 Tax=Drosophila persimilis TaxID=7234 RepID=B4H7G9_DROPE|nr:GL27025 [Drosophila persimilis]
MLHLFLPAAGDTPPQPHQMPPAYPPFGQAPATQAPYGYPNININMHPSSSLNSNPYANMYQQQQMPPHVYPPGPTFTNQQMNFLPPMNGPMPPQMHPSTHANMYPHMAPPHMPLNTDAQMNSIANLYLYPYYDPYMNNAYLYPNMDPNMQPNHPNPHWQPPPMNHHSFCAHPFRAPPSMGRPMLYPDPGLNASGHRFGYRSSHGHGTGQFHFHGHGQPHGHCHGHGPFNGEPTRHGSYSGHSTYKKRDHHRQRCQTPPNPPVEQDPTADLTSEANSDSDTVVGVEPMLDGEVTLKLRMSDNVEIIEQVNCTAIVEIAAGASESAGSDGICPGSFSGVTIQQIPVSNTNHQIGDNVSPSKDTNEKSSVCASDNNKPTDQQTQAEGESRSQEDNPANVGLDGTRFMGYAVHTVGEDDNSEESNPPPRATLASRANGPVPLEPISVPTNNTGHDSPQMEQSNRNMLPCANVPPTVIDELQSSPTQVAGSVVPPRLVSGEDSVAGESMGTRPPTWPSPPTLDRSEEFIGPSFGGINFPIHDNNPRRISSTATTEGDCINILSNLRNLNYLPDPNDTITSNQNENRHVGSNINYTSDPMPPTVIEEPQSSPTQVAGSVVPPRLVSGQDTVAGESMGTRPPTWPSPPTLDRSEEFIGPSFGGINFPIHDNNPRRISSTATTEGDCINILSNLRNLNYLPDPNDNITSNQNENRHVGSNINYTSDPMQMPSSMLLPITTSNSNMFMRAPQNTSPINRMMRMPLPTPTADSNVMRLNNMMPTLMPMPRPMEISETDLSAVFMQPSSLLIPRPIPAPMPTPESNDMVIDELSMIPLPLPNPQSHIVVSDSTGERELFVQATRSLPLPMLSSTHNVMAIPDNDRGASNDAVQPDISTNPSISIPVPPHMPLPRPIGMLMPETDRSENNNVFMDAEMPLPFLIPPRNGMGMPLRPDRSPMRRIFYQMAHNLNILNLNGTVQPPSRENFNINFGFGLSLGLPLDMDVGVPPPDLMPEIIPNLNETLSIEGGEAIVIPDIDVPIAPATESSVNSTHLDPMLLPVFEEEQSGSDPSSSDEIILSTESSPRTISSSWTTEEERSITGTEYLDINGPTNTKTESPVNNTTDSPIDQTLGGDHYSIDHGASKESAEHSHIGEHFRENSTAMGMALQQKDSNIVPDLTLMPSTTEEYRSSIDQDLTLVPPTIEVYGSSVDQDLTLMPSTTGEDGCSIVLDLTLVPLTIEVDGRSIEQVLTLVPSTTEEEGCKIDQDLTLVPSTTEEDGSSIDLNMTLVPSTMEEDGSSTDQDLALVPSTTEEEGCKIDQDLTLVTSTTEEEECNTDIDEPIATATTVDGTIYNPSLFNGSMISTESTFSPTFCSRTTGHGPTDTRTESPVDITTDSPIEQTIGGDHYSIDQAASEESAEQSHIDEHSRENSIPMGLALQEEDSNIALDLTRMPSKTEEYGSSIDESSSERFTPPVENTNMDQAVIGNCTQDSTEDSAAKKDIASQ